MEEAISSFRLSSEDEEEDDLPHTMVLCKLDTCSICMEPLSNTTHALQCGHEYHTRCIIDWFRLGNASCPLCRCAKINAEAQVVDFDDAIRILMKKAKNKI